MANRDFFISLNAFNRAKTLTQPSRGITVTHAPLNPAEQPRRIVAQTRAHLSATLFDVRELRFAHARPEADLPDYMRSASGIRRWQRYFAIVQDDVHAIGLLERDSGALESILLPRGADGRRVFSDALGNKALKMDLEACVVLADGRFVAFGSGSTPAREVVVIIRPDRSVRVVPASELYAQFHARRDFSGSELNLEGALVRGDTLRVFQRGNGAPLHELSPLNAFADMDVVDFVAWLDGKAGVPTLGPATQVVLGKWDGVAFDFTDAALLPDGRIAFIAGAEDSPDAYQDGAIVGCRFGILDGDKAWICDIFDENGARSLLKLEGIEFHQTGADGSFEFLVVADMDDPTSPAPIARLRVMGAG